MIAKVQPAIDDLPGWCSVEKGVLMYNAVLQTKATKCVELGVFGGRGTISMALAAQTQLKGSVVAIDPWSNKIAAQAHQGKEHVEWWSGVDMADVYSKFIGRVISLGLNDHVQVLKETSQNAAWWIGKESVGVLHVDGDHTEEVSLADAIVYLPKVAPGGIIFWDDISWQGGTGKYQTRQGLDYLLTHGCRVMRLVDDCMILKKEV